MSELAELIRKSVERVSAMPSDELAAMHKAQRASFVRGMGPCEHGVRDFEDCIQCRQVARGNR